MVLVDSRKFAKVKLLEWGARDFADLDFTLQKGASLAALVADPAFCERIRDAQQLAPDPIKSAAESASASVGAGASSSSASSSSSSSSSSSAANTGNVAHQSAGGAGGRG